MLLTVSEINPEEVFDFCIVGTGPAGITLALALASSGKRILLLEGGKERRTEASQILYQGKVIGDKYVGLAKSRLRYFGGSSNHWGGWCRTLSEEDFRAKGDYTNTEWPIRKSDLDPYLKEASSILEIGKIPQDRLFGSSGLMQVEFAFSSPPLRFASKYRGEIVRSKNIFLVLSANVASFETKGTTVTYVNLFTDEGAPLALRADTYVLATGGIENSRILLWSNELSGGQLVKSKETLGKYWMEHPHFIAGDAILIGSAADKIDQGGYAFFSPTVETMLKNQTLNCVLRIEQSDILTARNIIADLACVAPRVAMRFANLLDGGSAKGARIRTVWEQEPTETNRIELSDKLDRFGIPRVNLYWKKSDIDLRTVRTAVEILAEYFAQEDIGRARIDDWVSGKVDYPTDDWLVGAHHMGGTRMASTPENGVVDTNCKVFGQDNLYVAGSSVFPSSGYANPTLTIVQLSLRLGNHLVKRA